jgi:hypothetical protein
LSRLPWLIYALGGGWGHLTRALSLGRNATPYTTVQILTNSPYTPHLPSQDPAIQIESIPSTFNRQEVGESVQRIVKQQNYGCLIVDTFPRGLGGELASVLPHIHTCPRILVHRDINPDYVQQKNLHSFVAEHFDQIIVPGDGDRVPFATSSQVIHTCPWLVRNTDELLDMDSARSILRLNDNPQRQLIIVLASGRAEELEWYGQITRLLSQQFPTVDVRCLAMTCPNPCPVDYWVAYYPAIALLWVADVVIGGGGYNTVYECQALGIPLIATPFQRLYDRQELRVNGGRSSSRENFRSELITVATNLDDVFSAVHDLLKTHHLANRVKQTPQFVNGAVDAVHQILAIL